jgi:hypothetical protein
MATLAQQLTSVQAAIAAIEGGAQSITAADGRTYTRASLQTLYDREKALLLRTERASGQARRVAEF